MNNQFDVAIEDLDVSLLVEKKVRIKHCEGDFHTAPGGEISDLSFSIQSITDEYGDQVQRPGWMTGDMIEKELLKQYGQFIDQL